MNLELILWIISAIIISELIFIFWYGYLVKRDNSEGWGWIKVFSFLIGGLFMFIQFGVCQPKLNSPNMSLDLIYSHLLYELGIIIFVGLLILINYLISERIKKGVENETTNGDKRKK